MVISLQLSSFNEVGILRDLINIVLNTLRSVRTALPCHRKLENNICHVVDAYEMLASDVYYCARVWMPHTCHDASWCDYILDKGFTWNSHVWTHITTTLVIIFNRTCEHGTMVYNTTGMCSRRLSASPCVVISPAVRSGSATSSNRSANLTNDSLC